MIGRRQLVARLIRQIVLLVALIRFGDVVGADARPSERVTVVSTLHHIRRRHHVWVLGGQDDPAVHKARLACQLDPVAVVDDLVGDADDSSQYALAVAVVQVVVERRHRLAQHDVRVFKSLFDLEGA